MKKIKSLKYERIYAIFKQYNPKSHYFPPLLHRNSLRKLLAHQPKIFIGDYFMAQIRHFQWTFLAILRLICFEIDIFLVSIILRNKVFSEKAGCFGSFLSAMILLKVVLKYIDWIKL